jgi:hypothetical protein
VDDRDEVPADDHIRRIKSLASAPAPAPSGGEGAQEAAGDGLETSLRPEPESSLPV